MCIRDRHYAATLAASPASIRHAAAAAKRAEPHHVVTFESQTIRASVGQTLAAVTLLRERPLQGRTRVRWHTVDGSAKAGIHYTPVDSEVATFADGQRVRSLFVPILQNAGHPGARPARSFTIRIEPADDQAPGAIADAEVVIAAVD